ncbi:hypothetical protein [Halobacillus salinus]|uniref:hypothetical protein n=1 Tax=Halobacillus salinus TaxID=192814 RepID=UPI0009A6C8D7|nr:hypothetical protein [Halobacillus salinus]
MRKIWFVLWSLLVVTACQRGESDSEFTLVDMYPLDLQPGQNYIFITTLEWEGTEGTTLQSVDLISEETVPPVLSQSTFYIGAATKSTGVSNREEIGEKQAIEGYAMEEKQTLIMETKIPETPTDQAIDIRFTYEVDGEEYEQEVEWDTLSELTSSDVIANQQAAVPLEEKPTFQLTRDGEQLPFEVVSECWGAECSEEADYIKAEVLDITRDIAPVPMRSGGFLEVDVMGEEVDELEYKRLVDSIFVEDTLREGVLPFENIGTHRLMLTGRWYDNQGLFQGKKTIALVLDVTE